MPRACFPAVNIEFYWHDCNYKSMCDTLVCTESEWTQIGRWECILLSSSSYFCSGQASRLNASKQKSKQNGLSFVLWAPRKSHRKIARQWFVCIGMAESALSQISLNSGQKKNSLMNLRRNALGSST